jgi:P4 family phage/plasmid primase-like protien
METAEALPGTNQQGFRETKRRASNLTNTNDTTSGAIETYLAQDWPLIAIQNVGPDGTCHCKDGRNCSSPGKHPKGPWREAEPLTADQIRGNIGVKTGAESGFFVIDVDAAGMDAMAALVKENGALPPTRRHQTGGGTYHLFFNQPADFDVTNRRGSLPIGIDVRGTGGYVVLPPSKSGKGLYSVVSDAPIADAPAWILDMLRPGATPAPQPITMDEPAAAPTPAREEHLVKYEAMVINKEIDRLATMAKKATATGEGYDGEPWDIGTYEVACTLMQLARSDWTALTLEEARAIVLEHAPRDAGFSDARVTDKVDSAVRSTEGKTRALPSAPRESNTSWMDEIDTPAAAPAAATPDAAPAKSEKPARPHPGDFFDKDGLRAADLAKAVFDEGPIRWGQNQRWWVWDPKGVWTEDKLAVQNRTIDILKNRYRGAHVSNAEDIVKRFADDLVIDSPDSSRINFANGMLDWSAQTMHPHSPESASTVQIPWFYEPDATCERFDAFLDSVMSPDYQKLVWEMIGYLLYSGNPLQVAFLLHGSGGNGKGTLIKVITAMLGKENLAHQSLDALNGDKFAAANLFGKIANIAGDIDATFQESTARFKMLTGEDRFSGEYKYGDSFGFNNFAVPLFSANKIPGSADVSKGYLRRWVNIEFDRVFSGEPIAGLGESLAATEIPGVIAKGIKHLGGLLASGFTIEGEATKGRDEFAKSIDQVRQWVEADCLEVPETRVKQDDLYTDYKFWAAHNGNGKLKASDFYARLEGAGFARRKIRGERFFVGISLLGRFDPTRVHAEKTMGDWRDEIEG